MEAQQREISTRTLPAALQIPTGTHHRETKPEKVSHVSITYTRVLINKAIAFCRPKAVFNMALFAFTEKKNHLFFIFTSSSRGPVYLGNI